MALTDTIIIDTLAELGAGWTISRSPSALTVLVTSPDGLSRHVEPLIFAPGITDGAGAAEAILDYFDKD